MKQRVSQEVPVWCEEFFAQFGKTSYGENVWRVVWGWDRLYSAKTPEGDMQFPLYSLETDWHLDCWILERWVKEAAAQEDGRFGRYDFCHALMTPPPNRTFMPLEMAYLRLIIELITKGQEDYNFHRNRQAILDRMAQADTDHAKKVAAIWQQGAEEAHDLIKRRPSRLDEVPINYAVEQPKVGIHQESDIAKALKFRKLS